MNDREFFRYGSFGAENEKKINKNISWQIDNVINTSVH
jgi:hypothetical protein